MTEIITITAVKPTAGYRLLVTFDDGAVKEIDLDEMLADARGVFRPLRDRKIFEQVHVNPDSRTVEWPGEIDLDPEVLYGLFEPASGRPMTRRTIREPMHAVR